MAQQYVHGPALIFAGIPTIIAGGLTIPPSIFPKPEELGIPPPLGGPPIFGGKEPKIPLLPPPITVSPEFEIPLASSTTLLSILSLFTPYFLGTTVSGVWIDFLPQYDPWYTDEGGKVPADQFFDGEEALVIADLGVWNEEVYFVMATRASGSPANRKAPRG